MDSYHVCTEYQYYKYYHSVLVGASNYEHWAVLLQSLRLGIPSYQSSR